MEHRYEGIRFKVVMESSDLPRDSKIKTLKSWCRKFHDHNLAPAYPGGSYGNLSFRLKKGSNEFIITGSRIGLKDCLGNECFVKVRDVDLKKGIVYASGAKEPSSESMLHFAIYNARPTVNAVFHGHSGRILSMVTRMGLVETKKEQPYGTLKLVKEVVKVLKKDSFFVIKNHGFISIGKSLDDAGNLALCAFRSCGCG